MGNTTALIVGVAFATSVTSLDQINEEQRLGIAIEWERRRLQVYEDMLPLVQQDATVNEANVESLLRQAKLEVARRFEISVAELDAIVQDEQRKRRERLAALREKASHDSQRHWLLLGTLLVVNVPVSIWLGRIVFGDWETFRLAGRHTREGRTARQLVIIFLVALIFIIGAQYTIVTRLFF